MTLTRRRDSPKVRSIKVGVPDAFPVLAREAQVHGERGQVVFQAGDRRGVEPAVAGGELAGAAGRLSDGTLAGSLLDVIEDRPERRLDLGLGRLGHLGEHVIRQRWITQRWRRLGRKVVSNAEIRPGAGGPIFPVVPRQPGEHAVNDYLYGAASESCVRHCDDGGFVVHM